MRWTSRCSLCGAAVALSMLVLPGALRGQAPAVATDGVSALVGRLDLERYKATIKELTRFGDRQQGTDRNRAAVDWIEGQLRSYGCATERAYAALHGMLLQQASTVSFVWLFRLLGGIFLMLLPLILIMRRPKGRMAPGAAH